MYIKSTELSEVEGQKSTLSTQRHVVRIRPGGAGIAAGIRDIWSYRELLYFLAWKDIKVRYKQTVLGIAWAIMQPLFAMIIFTLFFGKLARVPSDGIPYPIFAYVGLLPWTFVSNTVISCGNSLVGSAHLITKVYFPRLIIPGAAIAVGLVDMAVAFPVLGILFVSYQIPVTSNIWALPFLLVLAALLTFAIGMWMAALNVKYRDVRFALPFLVQLWMFITPVIYPSSLVPSNWRWLIALNPLTGVVEGFRSCLLGREFDGLALVLSTVITLSLLVYAVAFFRRVERSFADII